MTTHATWSTPARGLIVAAAVVVVLAGLQGAAPLLGPILLAAFIAVVATPPLRLMRRYGAPKWAALLVIGFLLFDFGSLFALATTGALEGFRDSLPSYQERLVLLSAELGDWLEGLGMPNSREAVPDILDPGLGHGPHQDLSLQHRWHLFHRPVGPVHRPVHPARGGRHARQAEGGLQPHGGDGGTHPEDAVLHQPVHGDQDPGQPGHRSPHLGLAVVSRSRLRRSSGPCSPSC